MANGTCREYLLNNGLVVALQNTPTKTIAGKLRVNFGACYEEEGIAHFLEHCLVSGGSQKYSPQAADDIRGSFGQSNASTTIGRIVFEAQMLSEDLETWLSFISDHALSPRFDLERVNGERERVLREISDSKSNPTYSSDQEFKNVFYRGHPKGNFTLGKEEVIKNTSPEKIKGFYSRGFWPSNMDLLLAGDLPEGTENLIAKYFGAYPAGENMRATFPELPPLPAKTIIHKAAPDLINADNPEQSSAQIYLFFILPARTHPDWHAVVAMSNILGVNPNSLLFQSLGLKKGLAYSTGVSYDGSYNAGGLQAYAFVPARRINESVEVIFEEMQKMRSERVSEETVARIKRRVTYNLAQGLESNEGHISAMSVKLDEGKTPETIIKSYNEITPDRILEVSRKYLPTPDGKYVLYIRDPLKK